MRLSTSIRTALALTAGFTVQSAMADPSATVNKFMDTPASLFSIGIMRVDKAVEESVGTMPDFLGRKYFGGADFDWDRNQIILSVSRYDSEEPKEDFEDECKRIVERVRTSGMVINGKAVFEGVSVYASYFFPNGYSLKSISNEDGKNLDQLTHIEVKLVSGKTKSKCTAPLLGTGYSIEKQ